jgi:AcrR family transcriptional regulator
VGVKERRARERSEIREAMLAAVREIAAGEGWPAVSIRKIAERTEYSPTLLYQYFDSKDAVVHEIRNQGYEELLARYLVVIKREREPVECVHRLARVTIETAFEQPEVYKAMLGMDGTPCDPPRDATAHLEIGRLIRSSVQTLLDPDPASGQVASSQIDAYSEALFAALQGIVTMYLNELLPGGKKRALKTADLLVGGLIVGWRNNQA